MIIVVDTDSVEGEIISLIYSLGLTDTPKPLRSIVKHINEVITSGEGHCNCVMELFRGLEKLIMERGLVTTYHDYSEFALGEDETILIWSK